MQGVFLVINFGDRAHASGALLEAFGSVLREAAIPFQLVRSQSIPHCNELVGQAWEEGFRTVIVGGGDGTLNVVLNHDLAPRLTLGILPLGTVNALARTLGLDRRHPADALRKVLAAPAAPVAVGRLEDRRFICFASVGYDAEVVHRAQGTIKRFLRRGAFAMAGGWEAARIRSLPRFAFRVDASQPSRANLFVLSNIACYAGATLFSTEVQDHLFQGFASDTRSPFGLLRLVWHGIHGPPMTWVDRVPDARPFPSFRRLQILSRRPVAVQVDGEAFTPGNPRRLTFELEPRPQPFLLPLGRERIPLEGIGGRGKP